MDGRKQNSFPRNSFLPVEVTSMGNSTGKRPASLIQHPSKKRKLNKNPSSKSKPKTTTKRKDAIKETIDIPDAAVEDKDILSDQDIDLLDTYGGAAEFLNSLDRNGISRSKQETNRLRQLDAPWRKVPVIDDLPSVDSHDEDEGFWNSEISDDEFLDSSDDLDSMSDSSRENADGFDSDVEMPYEVAPRKLQERSQIETQGTERLPIKLKDGRIQKTGRSVALLPVAVEAQSESDGEMTNEMMNEKPIRDDAATGARFGRLAVIDILGNKSRQVKIQTAKDQIASICQEILSDPENSLSLLKRLHAFSLPSVTSATHPEPIPNDPLIQKLAFLSQMAVYKDIIPGYRIRSLTDKERSEKVSQAVARTREFEQGLVSVYQNYLRVLEAELKARNDLSETALQCICSLLTELVHFNFRVNLMSCVVAQLSKKSWSKTSQLCLNTIIEVFRNDLTGAASLELVRLINRMIKEKHFNVHPAVLSCLLHLRLKSELGVRSSESKADKQTWPVAQSRSKGKDAARRAKGKTSNQPHLSKKALKVLKEKKEIEREFRDAEAEVDKEERATTHTETLKLMFVLYFGILKNSTPTLLLPAALEGIIKYAHLVNIDFFRDLMQVLRGLILSDPDGDQEASLKNILMMQHRLLCIVTAFELLSGQGEALNMDLSDIISHLYAIILPLALIPALEFSSEPATPSLADMLFRALNIVFSPRTLGSTAPSWQSAAFAKRLLSSCMHWSAPVVVRTLQFVQGLVVKDPRLQALLSTEDRSFDGVYRPDLDDPQLSNSFGTCLWEVYALKIGHLDPQVKMEAEKLLMGSS
ncbi:nucleolar complex-associated protein-domain-containing protein [Lentinula lateritia]|uniref:Nucleolar complex-associated protein 3 n=1 Tax=Lentinula lateritia TaxID=40482 RepID=A0ABQ8VLL8_9AGAR|nr:nucleolar complex-associated protein-domain-containing protein [Lentinula lateritia]